MTREKQWSYTFPGTMDLPGAIANILTGRQVKEVIHYQTTKVVSRGEPPFSLSHGVLEKTLQTWAKLGELSTA